MSGSDCGPVRSCFFYFVFIPLSVFLFTCFLTPISAFAAVMPTVEYQGIVMTNPQPIRIAADNLGNVYVSDTHKWEVQKFDAFGKLLKTIRVVSPLGVAVDASGNIYIGSKDGYNVSVFNSSGTFVRKLGSGDGEVTMPSDISIDNTTGLIYVTDSKQHKVNVYSPTGTLLHEITGFKFPTGVYVDSAAGELFVGDQFNYSIKVFDTGTRSLLRSFGSQGIGPGVFYAIQGITVDDSGRIYVADSFNGLEIYSSVGVYLGNIGGVKAPVGRGGGGGVVVVNDPGALNMPMDVVIDSFGRLVVTSTNHSGIKYYGIDGGGSPPTDDYDGMPQDWEVANGLDPTRDDSAEDLDLDGLSNIEEYQMGTDPQEPDTDSDGMTDGWEVENGLDPLSDDSEGDPDDDGLSNLEEFNNGTDPNDSDTDDDGMPDGWEVGVGLDPLVDDANEDPDGDGFTNYEEYLRGGTDPFDPNSKPEPTVLHVDDDNTTGPWNGTVATPYRNIGDAVYYAITGDVIKVASGTYRENLSIARLKRFTMTGGWFSGFDTRDTDPSLSVIDGAGGGSVIHISTSGSSVVELTLDGFTLTGGASEKGGGLHIHSAGARVDIAMNSVIIKGNTADTGGGVSLWADGSHALATLTLTNTFIHNNNAGTSGGGISVFAENLSTATLRLVNDTVVDNTVVTGEGGGLFVSSDTGGSATATLLNDIVWGNTASEIGDDIYLLMYSGSSVLDVSYTDVEFVVNSGGVYNDNGSNLKIVPKFVDASSGNYHLVPFCALRGQGTIAGAPSFDFEGEVRPWGDLVDLGADEFTYDVIVPERSSHRGRSRHRHNHGHSHSHSHRNFDWIRQRFYLQFEEFPLDRKLRIQNARED